VSPSIALLKQELGPKLLREEQVTPPKGVATGWAGLDRYLLWKGFPKASLSLLLSEAGGATSLWTQAAARVTAQNQWVAWINNNESSLTPWVLRHRGVDLTKLFCVSQPQSAKLLLWALQELMSLCLFEMIGCDLGHLSLKTHQVLKLKKLAMRYQTAVVLMAPPTAPACSFYSLILKFERHHVTVNRALHRPTPFLLERRDLYADTLPLLAAGYRALCG
jgi:recombination protein RecA